MNERKKSINEEILVRRGRKERDGEREREIKAVTIDP